MQYGTPNLCYQVLGCFVPFIQFVFRAVGGSEILNLHFFLHFQLNTSHLESLNNEALEFLNLAATCRPGNTSAQINVPCFICFTAHSYTGRNVARLAIFLRSFIAENLHAAHRFYLVSCVVSYFTTSV